MRGVLAMLTVIACTRLLVIIAYTSIDYRRYRQRVQRDYGLRER